ncbi:MAG: DinB family protein [Bacteroidetes bacterium]|nr:DinB family protein [Bacteroidota bacterium]
MKNKFLRKYEILQSDKTKFLNFLDNFNNEMLNLKPNKDKWSLAQILFHIIKGEQYTLISFLNSLKPETKLKTVRIITSIKSFFLNSALKTNFKFKAPPIVQKVPESININELLNKWNELRIGINKVCLNMPKDTFNKGVFKHPYIGMINLNQTLDFLIYHLKHHLKQVEKISMSLNKIK